MSPELLQPLEAGRGREDPGQDGSPQQLHVYIPSSLAPINLPGGAH